MEELTKKNKRLEAENKILREMLKDYIKENLELVEKINEIKWVMREKQRDGD